MASGSRGYGKGDSVNTKLLGPDWRAKEDVEEKKHEAVFRGASVAAEMTSGSMLDIKNTVDDALSVRKGLEGQRLRHASSTSDLERGQTRQIAAASVQGHTPFTFEESVPQDDDVFFAEVPVKTDIPKGNPDPDEHIALKTARAVLSTQQFFQLNRMILNKESPDALVEIPVRHLLEYAEQGIIFVDYMAELTDIEISDKYYGEIVQDNIFNTVYKKIREHKEIYRMIKADLLKCRDCFQKGMRFSLEGNVSDCFLDDAMHSSVYIGKKNMIDTLIYNFQSLILYMDHCHSYMPAPCELCPGLTCPDFSVFKDKAFKAPLRKVVGDILFEAKRLRANWDALDKLMADGVPDFIHNKKHYSVILPSDMHFPPTSDLDMFIRKKSEASDSGEIDVPGSVCDVVKLNPVVGEETVYKEIFKDKKAAKVCCEKMLKSLKESLKLEDMQIKSEKVVKTLSGSTARRSDYWEWRPVLITLLKQVSQRAQNLLKKAITNLDQEIIGINEKVRVKKDNKTLIIRQLAELEESATWWHTTIPSLQEVFSDIHEVKERRQHAEEQKKRRSFTVKATEWLQQKSRVKTPKVRRTTETASSSAHTESQFSGAFADDEDRCSSLPVELCRTTTLDSSESGALIPTITYTTAPLAMPEELFTHDFSETPTSVVDLRRRGLPPES